MEGWMNTELWEFIECRLLCVRTCDASFIVGIAFTAEVDPNWQTHRNETAGLLAARHGHCQCLRALVNAQADINLTTTEGFSPLFEGKVHIVFVDNVYFDYISTSRSPPLCLVVGGICFESNRPTFSPEDRPSLQKWTSLLWPSLQKWTSLLWPSLQKWTSLLWPRLQKWTSLLWPSLQKWTSLLDYQNGPVSLTTEMNLWTQYCPQRPTRWTNICAYGPSVLTTWP